MDIPEALGTISLEGGDWVGLRRAEPGDASIIARWKSEDLVRRMALDPDFSTSPAEEEHQLSRAADSSDEDYLLILAGSERLPAGYIRINWMDAQRSCGWLRFALGEQRFRGRGIAYGALRSLLSALFSIGAHRFEAEVYQYNEASSGLLRRLGFSIEGRKRSAHFDGRRYVDVFVFGLLAGELRDHPLHKP